jgi:uncharacterized membrane protein
MVSSILRQYTDPNKGKRRRTNPNYIISGLVIITGIWIVYWQSENIISTVSNCLKSIKNVVSQQRGVGEIIADGYSGLADALKNMLTLADVQYDLYSMRKQ